MKLKNLLIALIAITFSVTSCKKDDTITKDDTPSIKNKLSLDDKESPLDYGGYIYNEEYDDYLFSLSSDSPHDYLWGNTTAVSFIVQKAELGNKINLNVQNYEMDYSERGYIKFGTHHFNIRPENLSPTKDNWLKITKNNNGQHDYTIEFDLTMDNGERLKGYYKGNFQFFGLDDNYEIILPAT